MMDYHCGKLVFVVSAILVLSCIVVVVVLILNAGQRPLCSVHK